MACAGTARCEVSATCVDCGAPIARWRERFTPLRNGMPRITERGELAVRVLAPHACDACGASWFEVRVEETVAH
jgi:hypothetical protein